MFQSSSTSGSGSASNKDENRTGETISQLRVGIRTVRLTSPSKSIDVSVIMEVDSKYTYKTKVARNKNNPNSNSTSNHNKSIIVINESFDVLITSNSKIKLKILSPTRLFSSNEIGQLQFNIKTILDDYALSDQIHKNDKPMSYVVKLPFDSPNSTSLFRSNDSMHHSSGGLVELVFCGSLLEQKHKEYQENSTHLSTEQVESISLMSIFICQLCFARRNIMIHQI